jgi:hypothetical protein
MRKSSIQHRRQFFLGAIFGSILVVFKLIFFLPIDVADILYGIALLVTLIITIGEIIESKYFVLEAKTLDFIIGFLFPLDCYAVVILFGIPLTN